MIIQPDFLDHWKTALLIDLLKDPSAPLYIIRLWAHCQNRKTHGLPTGNPAAIKAICRASNHDANDFLQALIDSGFVEKQGDELIAHGWSETNSYLINSWENGLHGGRPKKQTQKKPAGNPQETHRKPTENPTVTQTEPISNREEKSSNREDKKSVCYTGAHAQFVNQIIEARQEFSRIKPEAIAIEIQNALGNACFEKNLGEFIADSANLLETPKNPLAMLRAYLNRNVRAENFQPKQERCTI
jgi:hypothetical protein